MQRAPLLKLTDIALGIGGDALFWDVNLTVHEGERLAVVGRNGCGKSTLLKIITGDVEPDAGTRALSSFARIGYMEQEPDLSRFSTLGDYALVGLGSNESYKIEMAAQGLKFDPAKDVKTASGGEQRRAALAKLIAQAPDLMLLDEPTNHLDTQAIEWLESALKSTAAAAIVISHDRAFLNAISRTTVWLDRGVLRRMDKGFAHFENWRDTLWQEEDGARHKLDRKIKAEARWAVEGISARRKRNMGRVRALQQLRAERKNMIKRPQTAQIAVDTGEQSGRKVIEARGLSKTFGERTILKSLNLTLTRGERLAIVGPNGAGKSTLVKMLLRQEKPDFGMVKHAHNLTIAVFDQNRSALHETQTLWDTLADDPNMAVAGRSDQIMVRGTPRHILGYLKDFLFSESQARAPVKSLSGGERARLLLAKLMARESNMLVFDEPTNDFDIETLDLLQDILGEYAGTCLIVSHDRDFLDRVATSTLALTGKGSAVLYAGGWSDYQAQKTLAEKQAKAHDGQAVKPVKAHLKAKNDAKHPKAKKAKLTFTQAHRLKELPQEIARLESEIKKLTLFLSQPDLYQKDAPKFEKASRILAQHQEKLKACEEEWLSLELAAEEQGKP